MATKWYSLFSHTGKETENIRNQCRKVQLEAALTTNLQYEGSLPYVKLISGRYVNEWLMESENVEPGSVITLNGYMRILPAEVLDYLHSKNCRVYNIHPAPIWLYPELRGKDPQERLYTGIQEGKYACIGIVIHEIDSGVDTGKVVYWKCQIADPDMTLDQLYEELHAMGTNAWIDYLEEICDG